MAGLIKREEEHSDERSGNEEGGGPGSGTGELDDRGVLVDSLLEQYDGLEGMDLAEVQALLGEHPYTREDPEVGMYRDGYYIGAGRENSGREEVMVLQFRDGEVIRVEFEDAG